MTDTSVCVAKTPVGAESQPAPDITTVRETVKEHFPSLWPAVTPPLRVSLLHQLGGSRKASGLQLIPDQ